MIETPASDVGAPTGDPRNDPCFRSVPVNAFHQRLHERLRRSASPLQLEVEDEGARGPLVRESGQNAGPPVIDHGALGSGRFRETGGTEKGAGRAAPFATIETEDVLHPGHGGRLVAG
jgi:hypothetical protein